MDSELEVIRSEMEATRSSLADKLEALESQVRGTVETATEAVATARETVTSTVESVQDTVENVKEAVRETFDVVGHTQRYPWAMVGGAFAAGFLGGCLIPPARREAESTPAYTPAPADSGSRSSLADTLSGPLGDGLTLLKGMAVGGIMGLVRDMVRRAVPPNYTADATRWVDELTTSLGGKPVPLGEGNNYHNRGEI